MGLNEEKFKEKRVRLCHYLAVLAREKGIIQEEIADKTGFTRNNVSRILSGRYSPSLDNLMRIAEAINYDIALIKKYDKSDKGNIPLEKFILSVDPKNNELYILHRQFPACLILVKQEMPMRFIIQDLYDEMEHPEDILNMPFIEEAKKFFRDYSGSILDLN